MPPFRNLLGRKPQPNAGDAAVIDENYLSPNQRPAPIPIRNSQDEPTEYKLSGMIVLGLDHSHDLALSFYALVIGIHAHLVFRSGQRQRSLSPGMGVERPEA
jgi:hypothetical protein